MNMQKADLILHPVRLRIITVLTGKRKLTPQQIAEQLHDIPQATLYRQLNTLVKGGILEVENHRQVRGAMEKIYSLPEGNALLGKQDLSEANSEDFMRIFSVFLSSLLGDYGRYLTQDDYDHHEDGVSYRKVSLYLDDEENLLLLKQIRALIQQADERGAEPRPGRRLRQFAVISIPEPSNLQEDDSHDD